MEEVVEVDLAMLNHLARAVARRFKEKVAQSCAEQLVEVRVFGSMARGQAHAESDLDVFVLVDAPEGAADEAVVRAAREASSEFGYPFLLSPLIMTREHFSKLIGLERLLARDILTEGIVI